MKTYYYCIHDSYGQRTGEVRSIELDPSDVEVNSMGFEVWRGLWLYSDKGQADRASLS